METTGHSISVEGARLHGVVTSTGSPPLFQLQQDTTSSIELTRDAKGAYGWKIKVYFGNDLADIGVAAKDESAALRRLHRVDLSLRDEYVVARE